MGEGSRLWLSTLDLPHPLDEYLDRHGFRSGTATSGRAGPLATTRQPTPRRPAARRCPQPEGRSRRSSSRAWSRRAYSSAPLLLHTGVASLKGGRTPYDEFYRVPPETARLVNAARRSGRRVVAVGTTAVRALETVTDEGDHPPGEGWTRLIVTPERGIRSVDSMITGLHEPRSSHLAMLEALAGREHLRAAYGEALREGYLWHEFGDLHLIL